MPSQSPALDDLAQRLAAAFAGRPHQLAWGASAIMHQSLEAVRDLARNRRGTPRKQRIARGIMALRIQGGNVDFVHLKYACYGIAQTADWDSRRLLENFALVQKLLTQVARLLPADQRRYKACCLGLQQSWREIAELPADVAHNPACQQSKTALQDFLFHSARKTS
ncbi:hypothetical protein FACS1894185_6370 [Betaproteobacteria bacterium]|nr:hypothetical protein AGMMS49545_09110 [Betaproteobacteria bacterium]GHU12146.1 hypothetical protein FACS1894185_6370 [Betaproteobacteria bacterium]GHU44013.1 hypothetical protein AGMMS50289_11450 [Betaproteobacteria bacterium]